MKKNILILFLLVFSMLGSIVTNGQTPQFYNANNSTSNNSWPLNAISQINNRCQWNYPPNAFSTLGGGLGLPAYAGLITDVYFRMGSTTNAATNYNINMAIGQTVGTQVSFANGTYITGLTPILANTSYSLTGVTNLSWYRVTLPTPILYNPATSFVFEIYQAGTGGGNLLSQNTAIAGTRIYGGQAATAGVLGTGLVDFGFDLIPNTPCVGMPNGGTTTGPINPCPGVLSTYYLTGATLASGLSYQWINSSVGCNGPWNAMVNDTNSSMQTLPPVGVTTYYRCIVTCDTLMLSDTSSCLAVTPQTWNPWSPCYCGNSSSTSTALEDIGQFNIGTLSNPTPAPTPQGGNATAINTYSNFDTLLSIPTFIQGQNYPISALQISSSTFLATSWFKTWIDYNHNTSWADPGEEIFSSISNITNGYNPTGTFTVPTTALPGLTRLRAVLNRTGAAGAVQPCGTYSFGETEDYIVNILSAGPYDPAVTNIQVNPSAGCMDSNGTIILTIPNYGGQTLDLSVNPIIITLNVNGPNGLTVYKDTLTSGLLQPFTANNTFSIFNPVNMYTGGNYTINTDTISIIGATNTNYVNDSLFAAAVVTNSRPNNGGDYTLCQGDTISGGNGLSILNCPTGLVQDSVLIPFNITFAGNNPLNPTAGSAQGASQFASGILPNLPPGANVLSGELGVSFLQRCCGFLSFTTNSTLTRFSLFQGATPATAANIYHNGLQGSTLTGAGTFDYVSTPPAVDLNSMYLATGSPINPAINIGHWNLTFPTASNVSINSNGTTAAYLKIVYEYVPMGISWYEQPSGGVRISNSSILNPLVTTNTILNNTTTPGTYTFYGACAADTNCRVASNLIITSLDFASVVDTATTCFGDSTGSVQAIMAGPPAVYTFTLSQGIAQIAQNQTGYFNALPFGTYNLNVTNAAGCSGDSTINISQPSSPLQITGLGLTQPNCNPGNNGAIVVSVSGGTTPYDYSNGFPPSQSNNTFLGLTANTYLITVTDDNGCQDTTSGTLVAPGGPTWGNVSLTDVACNGDSSGTIMFTSIPGASSIILDSIIAPANWVQPVTGGNVSGLPAGNYTIQASDANGCAITSVVMISQLAPLSIALISSGNVSCFGLSDGTISVSGTGGTTPNFSYSILPAAGTQPTAGNFIGLPTDTYLITITDTNNCTDTLSVFISEPAPVTYTSVLIDSVDCNGGNNGSIVVTGSGATPLTYGITAPMPIASSPAGTFSNLNSNTYTLRITDNGGCFSDSVVTVDQSAPFSIDTTSTIQVSCKGDSTGSIALTNSGGTGMISYSISPYPTATQLPSGTFINLPADMYTIVATDSKLCTAVSTVTLTEPLNEVVIDNIVSTSPSCNPGNDGIINVTGSGGTGTIQYRLNNGPLQPIGNFGGFNPGSQLLTAEDSRGCKADSLYLLTNSIAPSWTNVTSTNVDCYGDSTGSISGLATGGSGMLSYSLTPYAGSPASVGGNFTGLPEGTYTIVANDTNNCSISSVVVITENPLIVLSNVQTDSVNCNGGNDGSITLSALGGSGVLSGTYLPGNITANPNTPPNFTFGNLSAQSYTVRLTDVLGCMTDTILIIEEPSPLMVDSTTVTNVLCNGNSTGSIYVQSSGGTGVITYGIPSIPMSSVTGQFNNLVSGTYMIVSTDSKNCTISTSLIITQPLALSHTVAPTDAQCFGGTSGSIVSQGIDGAGTYSYLLLPNNITNTTGTFSGLGAGTNYQIVITDINGCTDTTAMQTIGEPTQMVFTSVTKQDISCFGGSTGAITVASNMGTGAHTYLINPSLGMQGSPGSFTQVPAGVYIITATDANLCTITTSVTVIENPPISFSSIIQNEELCFGDETGSITFVATGGVGPFTYIFDNTPPASGQTTYTNLGTGIYTIQAIDALGCTYDSNYSLTGPDRISFNEFDIVGTTCLDTDDGSVTLVATGGRGSRYNYALEPGFFVNTSGIFRDLAANLYSLRVMDTAGCFIDTTFSIDLPNDPMIVSIQKQDLECTGRGNEGRAGAVVSGGNPPYTYLWNSVPVQTTASATKLYQGFHTVVVVDAQGCLVSDSFIIEPGPCCTEVFLPNAFSPNGDGRNDEFRILSTAGIEMEQFEVYNRWGIRVWQTSHARGSWDGTYKGEPADIGSYHYVLRYRCLTDGQNYTKKGDIMIVR